MPLPVFLFGAAVFVSDAVRDRRRDILGAVCFQIKLVANPLEVWPSRRLSRRTKPNASQVGRGPSRYLPREHNIGAARASKIPSPGTWSYRALAPRIYVERCRVWEKATMPGQAMALAQENRSKSSANQAENKEDSGGEIEGKPLADDERWEDGNSRGETLVVMTEAEGILDKT